MNFEIKEKTPFTVTQTDHSVQGPSSRLAIVISHPIQYHIPWIKGLTDRKVNVKVFYTWSQSKSGSFYDSGFSRNIQWDIPLLEGYEFQFVKNVSKNPGTHHFLGIINPTLNQEIAEWEPHYIMITGWNFYSHLQCILHFKNKIPIIFYGDSTLLDESIGLKKLARRIFLKWVYRHIDFACYVGEHNRDYFLKHGVDENKLFYMPYSIDIRRFAEPDIHYSNMAKKWKDALAIPKNHLTVLYAGKLMKVKNPEFIINLAIRCKNMPVSFLVVGNGVLEKKLKKKAKNYTNIKFLDFQNQQIMPVVYRMGDVFILSSVSETWGMCINEAMACSKPIMVSKQAGCSVDLVEENITGTSFHLHETEKCVAFIDRLSESKAFAKEMGKNAKRKVGFFSVDHMVTRIYEMLLSLEQDGYNKKDNQAGMVAAGMFTDNIPAHSV